MADYFDFSKRITSKKLGEFADLMKDISDDIGFKVSARGWNYIMENRNIITKNEFDRVEAAINRCRKEGLLPVDFVAEEDARAFHNVRKPSDGTVKDTLSWMLQDVLDGQKYFEPDWWDGEKYYVQMLVEKIDLKTLFTPIVEKYKIPIANAKGWQSVLQRAAYSRRFKEAENNGLQCVLLYASDFDPDGLRIADTLRKNLHDLENVTWEDGEDGYDPSDLIIDRFCLDYQYILDNDYTWIDNLITSGGIDLSSSHHRNNKLPYVKSYIGNYGVRKCESNVLVTNPSSARTMCENKILEYLGNDAPERFNKKREKVRRDYEGVLQESGLKDNISKFLDR